MLMIFDEQTFFQSCEVQINANSLCNLKLVDIQF